MTVLMGRRRIGKTELARRCNDKTLLYFFVARKTESLLCQDFAHEAEERLGIPIGWPTSFSELFRYLLVYAETHPLTLVIDEFQEFQRVNPSIFSEMQRDWDLHKQKSHINLIISGSVFSLMKRIFEDAKEPLFGRANQNILIEEFGNDYAMHFSILTCLSGGQLTRGEIEAKLGTTNIGSYLARLENYYNLIEKRLPIFAKENEKKVRYALNDRFLDFWFRFFYKYQSYVANNALSQLALGSHLSVILNKNCAKKAITHASASFGTAKARTRLTSSPSTKSTELPRFMK